MTTLSIEKGDKINITKEAGGHSLFVVGLGWNTTADLDASAFLCQQDPAGGNAKCVGTPGVVYFRQKEAPGIKHLGDALSGTGNAPGDPDEYITIDGTQVQADVDQIDVWANIYNARAQGLTFRNVKDAFIAIYAGERQADGSIAPKGEPMVRYPLNEDYATATAVQFGSLYRSPGSTDWRFNATDSGQVLEIGELINSYVPGAV